VVESGAIVCTRCGLTFETKDGVPTFLIGRHSRSVQQAFSQQWEFRRRGQLAEEGDDIFGRSARDRALATAAHFRELFESTDKGLWFVDGGCGTGQLLARLAERYPHVNYVGLEFSDGIFEVAKRYRHLKNIDWICGDVANPPFRDGVFHGGVSYGVLHACVDTRSAFDALAATIKPGGKFRVWLYPPPGETDRRFLWYCYYGLRDWGFLGMGHRLPPKVVLGLLRALLLPIRLVRGRRRYDYATFLLYDDIMPRYQYRHARKEVAGWFRAQGFAPVVEDSSITADGGPEAYHAGVRQ
jgi:SAM-dependent methyltransferase